MAVIIVPVQSEARHDSLAVSRLHIAIVTDLDIAILDVIIGIVPYRILGSGTRDVSVVGVIQHSTHQALRDTRHIIAPVVV
jgi:hypothetical protein